MSETVFTISDEQPFGMRPTPEEIARWWVKNVRHYEPNCDGFDLWRQGREYVYGWPTVVADHDMQVHYLLDIRTHDAEFEETRDFLYVSSGYDGVTWAMHDHPIACRSGADAHRERDRAGMIWLADKIQEHYEEYDAREEQRRTERDARRGHQDK